MLYYFSTFIWLRKSFLFGLLGPNDDLVNVKHQSLKCDCSLVFYLVGFYGLNCIFFSISGQLKFRDEVWRENARSGRNFALNQFWKGSERKQRAGEWQKIPNSTWTWTWRGNEGRIWITDEMIMTDSIMNENNVISEKISTITQPSLIETPGEK